jgi:hypothetical protein
MLFQDFIISRFRGFKDFEAIHTLTDLEKRQVKKLFITSLCFSAFFGGMGVFLLYYPHQLFPGLFPWHEFSHPFVGTIKFKWAFSIYGLVLAFIEIFLLVIVNLLAVSRLAKIYQFPQKDHPDKEFHKKTLIDMSFEKKPKKMLEMGIDPHQGMNKWAITAYVFVLSLKASISNIFVKLLTERVVGRFFLVEYIDYIGIPIFAAWNVYGTYQVLKNAKQRIVCTNIIDDYVGKLTAKYKDGTIPKYIFKEVLQFVAYCKRNFDHNHFYLTKSVMEKMDISQQKVYCDLNKIVTRLKGMPKEEADDMVSMVVLGIVIDGNVNLKEETALKRFRKEQLLQMSISQIKEMAVSVSEGKMLS